MNIETHHTQADLACADFCQALQHWLADHPADDPERLTQQTQLLDRLARHTSTAYFLLDPTRQKIRYCSENVQPLLGVGLAKIYQQNFRFLFRHLHPDQLGMPAEMTAWAQQLTAKNRRSGRHTLAWQNFHLVGLQLLQPGEDRYLTTALRLVPLYEPARQSALVLAALHDVTPAFKASFHWARATFGPDGEKVAHFHSAGVTNRLQDVISDREKQVLTLVAQGQSSKQIAEELFISQNTVDRHRKNMLARTGAKDTTALIHLCGLTGVI